MDNINNKYRVWQSEELSRNYLEGIRVAIPLADLQIQLMMKIINTWRKKVTSFLDLGCGDGILGRAILNAYPETKGIFIDFSDSMIEAAHKKIRTSESIKIIKSDFTSSDWQHGLGDNKDFDVIVSGFAIHHQPDDRKKELYKETYGLLAPSGIFLNLEHVASSTDTIKSIFDDYFIDHLYAFHRHADSNTTRQEVAEKYYNHPDKSANILTLVEIQCAWLREIGFKDVDCFFKVFELALFGGRKL